MLLDRLPHANNALAREPGAGGDDAARPRARFGEEDLARIFDPAILKRGRTLVLSSAVTLTATEPPTIEAIVAEQNAAHRVRLTPAPFGNRLVFSNNCDC